MTETLSQSALDIIDLYLALPFFRTKTIACPYFNNKRVKIRAALGVCVGKGSPSEIVQEAELLAWKEHIDLTDISVEQLKKFLVDHGLGIDCSGLAYHVLNAQSKEQKRKELKKILRFPLAQGMRKLIVKLRPIENTGVKSFAHEENSCVVSLANARPGDFIVMLKSHTPGNPDHLLIIHAVEKNEAGNTTVLYYTHALSWTTDGQYGGHVRQGQIEITDVAKPLATQQWEEDGKTDTQNETLGRAKDAAVCELRRLSSLS